MVFDANKRVLCVSLIPLSFVIDPDINCTGAHAKILIISPFRPILVERRKVRDDLYLVGCGGSGESLIHDKILASEA